MRKILPRLKVAISNYASISLIKCKVCLISLFTSPTPNSATLLLIPNLATPPLAYLDYTPPSTLQPPLHSPTFDSKAPPQSLPLTQRPPNSVDISFYLCVHLHLSDLDAKICRYFLLPLYVFTSFLTGFQTLL